MLWAMVSVACIGVLLGLRLRVASVLAASLLLAVVSTALLPLLAKWSLLKMAGFLFALCSMLQCGYLAGAIIAFSKKRARAAVNLELPRVGRQARNEVPGIR
jgi:hypothetical protein